MDLAEEHRALLPLAAIIVSLLLAALISIITDRVKGHLSVGLPILLVTFGVLVAAAWFLDPRGPAAGDPSDSTPQAGPTHDAETAGAWPPSWTPGNTTPLSTQSSMVSPPADARDDLPQQVPATKKVATEVPATKKVATEVPATKKVATEVPATKKVASGEVDGYATPIGFALDGAFHEVTLHLSNFTPGGLMRWALYYPQRGESTNCPVLGYSETTCGDLIDTGEVRVGSDGKAWLTYSLNTSGMDPKKFVEFGVVDLATYDSSVITTSNRLMVFGFGGSP